MSGAKIFWFTGMSGAGKSTIAAGLKEYLDNEGKKVLLLDGDKVRSTLNKHLGFSREDILSNNASIVKQCADNMSSWDCILVAVISPYSQSREEAHKVFGENYFEIYVRASKETLISRDTKGLYRRALNGEIKNFIGIDKNTPYEPPKNPDIIIDTERCIPSESVEKLIDFITVKI